MDFEGFEMGLEEMAVLHFECADVLFGKLQLSTYLRWLINRQPWKHHELCTKQIALWITGMIKRGGGVGMSAHGRRSDEILSDNPVVCH